MRRPSLVLALGIVLAGACWWAAPARGEFVRVLDTRLPRDQQDTGETPYGEVAFARDGKSFAFHVEGGEFGEIRVFDLVAYRWRTDPPPIQAGFLPQSISYDGAELVISSSVAIYRVPKGSNVLERVVGNDTPRPDRPGNFLRVTPGRPAVWGGNVVFIGGDDSIWIAAPDASLSKVWDRDDVWCEEIDCPPSLSTFLRFLGSSILGHSIAFASGRGVFASSIEGGSLVSLRDVRDVRDASFLTILGPVHGGRVAYEVQGDGLFLTAERIVDLREGTRTEVPEGMGVFDDVEGFFTQGERLVFEGRGPDNPMGIYLYDGLGGGRFSKVVAPGDTIEGRTVRGVELGATSAQLGGESLAGGRILFEVFFRDGLKATYVTGSNRIAQDFENVPPQEDTTGTLIDGQNVFQIKDITFSDVASLVGVIEKVGCPDLATQDECDRLVIETIFFPFPEEENPAQVAIMSLVGADFLGFLGPKVSPGQARAANDPHPAGGPFARFFAIPRDLRGYELAASFRKRSGDAPAFVRPLWFQDGGRTVAAGPYLVLPPEQTRLAAPVSAIDELLVGAGPFDPTRVDGVGFEFSGLANPLPAFVFEVDNIELVPEPGTPLLRVTALAALLALCRRCGR